MMTTWLRNGAVPLLWVWPGASRAGRSDGIVGGLIFSQLITCLLRQ